VPTSPPDYYQQPEGYAAGMYNKDLRGIAQDMVHKAEEAGLLQGASFEEDVPEKLDLLAHHASQILDNIAPGWRDMHHMKDTPMRYAQQILDLTTREEFKFTTFEATSDEMIVIAPVPFYTLCAHHVIPFYGQAYIGYVPGKTIAGLSKFGRLVKWAAKGLWVQEELTGFIASELESRLSPRGVAVILEGEHLCMAMRGVEMPGVVTTTSSMRGVFGDHTRTAKAEFMQLIEGKRRRG
jgi:GTP cyclohydrolase I